MYYTPEIQSTNGSSDVGLCASPISVPNATLYSKCNSSGSLLDGKIFIPQQLGKGVLWASLLFTMYVTDSLTHKVMFDLAKTYPEVYNGMHAVEVVMFNCPEWEISASSIKVLGAQSYPPLPFPVVDSTFHSVATKDINTTSCSSLVRVCVPVEISGQLPIVALEFHLPPNSSWVHIAEVRFHVSRETCPVDVVLELPPSIFNQGEPESSTEGSKCMKLATVATTPKLQLRISSIQVLFLMHACDLSVFFHSNHIMVHILYT